MAKAKDPPLEAGEPRFTKAQLVNAKAAGIPRDVLQAVLTEGETYTKAQAAGLAADFFNRKV